MPPEGELCSADDVLFTVEQQLLFIFLLRSTSTCTEIRPGHATSYNLDFSLGVQVKHQYTCLSTCI